MAIKVSYVVKESVNNLRRNFLMTAAALLTVIISLALAGAALLFRSGVDNATILFKGGFEITVMMKADATQDQIDAVGRDLRTNPQILQKGKGKVTLISREDSFKEIKKFFQNDPVTSAAFATPADAPVQYRFKPVDAEQLEAIGKRFESRAGVDTVVYAKTVKLILSVAQKIQLVVLCIAAVLLVSAVILILNTIRMAISSRRREVAVMKLVGATNGFIRLPFMVEGMLQGLLGASIGFGLVAIGARWAQSAIRHGSIPLLKQVSVTSTQVIGTGIVMLAVGAIVGAVGSGLAVSRFLDV
jgi:cell division transport system permease protein